MSGKVKTKTWKRKTYVVGEVVILVDPPENWFSVKCPNCGSEIGEVSSLHCRQRFGDGNLMCNKCGKWVWIDVYRQLAVGGKQ